MEPKCVSSFPGTNALAWLISRVHFVSFRIISYRLCEVSLLEDSRQTVYHVLSSLMHFIFTSFGPCGCMPASCLLRCALPRVSTHHQCVATTDHALMYSTRVHTMYHGTYQWRTHIRTRARAYMDTVSIRVIFLTTHCPVSYPFACLYPFAPAISCAVARVARTRGAV